MFGIKTYVLSLKWFHSLINLRNYFITMLSRLKICLDEGIMRSPAWNHKEGLDRFCSFERIARKDNTSVLGVCEN